VGGRPKFRGARPRPHCVRRIATRFGSTAVALFVLALVAIPSASASNNVNRDKKRIVELEAQIEAAGNLSQTLVAQYDKELAKQQQIHAALVATGRAIASDEAATRRAANRLRTLAVDSYVYAGSSSGVAAIIGVPSALSDVASVYAQLASGKLQTAATTYLIDFHTLSHQRKVLGQEQASVEAVMRQLIPDQHSAEAAIARETEQLASAKGDLKVALALVFREHEAQERQEEQEAALAKRQTVATASAPLPAPTTPTAQANANPGGPSGYENPLRAIAGLSPERIDQGVDYMGYGPIYAIGDGVILSTVNGGWPGGTFITYKLESGPAAGLVVYAAEDINPSVYIGQQVNANTVIGTMYEGWSGIETGWANGSEGDTMAMTAGQFGGSNSTAFGWNFDQLLVSLGAPGGILESGPTGAVPSGWPTW
jgi:murein DD-endopeptidase MepM/ murein hydrolase activator NlpD